MSEAPAYRVLARKYRPQGFDALIGQDAMVQTLGNAIAKGRLAQAWLLTGVRGVGKTSTARIIAKALNCTGRDGTGGPTISPCGVCDACTAITAGQHIDVIEMDAASNTGIDDIREIIEAVRYATVSARYKIYIIDEVHMLSKNAFNGLLKTLEEPPPHVKFIFATTEVAKVPVTILSRCQRFDLKRVPVELLAAHFAGIAKAEEVGIEPEALTLIARAAEGSVRDGLSILDQAIAHSAGSVTAAQLRDMLGLADRGQTRALMALLLAGDAPGVLAHVAHAHALGVEPQAMLNDLLDLTHGLTRARLSGSTDVALAQEDRAMMQDWAAALDFPLLHRLWQLLLKGLAETNAAPNPMQAAEMALLRICHASSLPDPAELVRRLSEQADAPAAPAAPPPRAPMVPAAPAALAAIPPDFAALVALFEGREPMLANLLHDAVALADYAPPRLALSALRPLDAGFAKQLAAHLAEWTGAAWDVSVTRGEGQSLHAAAMIAEAARREAALADPTVKALFAAFPDAELIEPRSAA
ncbi:DNA polymerase III subunit gamma/tau [Sandaracinobacteroides saxicola]|uniref:DNA polymerase III subunit gamma/tau n=1 Tax=Sandaracinobacteroides saxicola TaxID=2759707 RepID=A0A7G5IIA6_9SPHN|nr:DNA polymerase III subunit gamma/tau [Sandaracinobacteroides saxicola]QMW23098.1 DNA polymerase III subunit gamma/tau [Sandaracinobacteroides saxicola]